MPVLSKAISERVNAIFKSFKGDATLAFNGTVTIASGAVTEPRSVWAVTESKIADGAITSRKAKLTTFSRVNPQA